MRESAVMIEALGPAPEAADDVEVSGFGGQCERGGRERRLAVEPSAAHGGAE